MSTTTTTATVSYGEAKFNEMLNEIDNTGITTSITRTVKGVLKLTEISAVVASASLKAGVVSYLNSTNSNKVEV